MSEVPSTTTRNFGEFARTLRESSDRIAFFRSEEGQLAVDREFSEAMSGIEFVSVDVFDTLLLRTPTSELRRFYEWGKEVAAHLGKGRRRPSGEDVVLARLAAARVAYRLAGAPDGRLEPIVRATLVTCGLDPSKVEAAIELELDAEARDHTAPNEALWRALNEMVEAGIAVVLFSDMYLSEAHLSSLLDRHEMRHSAIPVFTSADRGVSKRGGDAFTWATSEFGVAPERSLHVGDNRLGDFLRPIEVGWRARLWPLADAHRAAVVADHWQAQKEISEAGGRVPTGWSTPGVEE